jgi:NADPH2:quinone reductase
VQRNLECAAMDGRIVQIAFQQGYKIENFDMRPISAKRIMYTGSTLRPRTIEQKGAIAEDLFKRVWPLFAQGKCRPVIDSTFPLRDVAKAHSRMEESHHIGKIVLTI